MFSFQQWDLDGVTPIDEHFGRYNYMMESTCLFIPQAAAHGLRMQTASVDRLRSIFGPRTLSDFGPKSSRTTLQRVIISLLADCWNAALQAPQSTVELLVMMACGGRLWHTAYVGLSPSPVAALCQKLCSFCFQWPLMACVKSTAHG